MTRDHEHRGHAGSGTHGHRGERGLFMGGLWAGRILCGLLVGAGLWNAAGTSVFVIRSKATIGHVVGGHDVDVPVATRSGSAGTIPLRTRSSNPPFLSMTSRYVEVEYRDRTGQLRWATLPEAACWRTHEARLPIRYGVDDPNRVLVNTFFGLWAKAIMLVVLGAIGWAGVEFVMG